MSNDEVILRKIKQQNISVYGKYSWPSDSRGLGGVDPLCSQKCVYNFWLLKNLAANSLLFTRSLTDNTVN